MTIGLPMEVSMSGLSAPETTTDEPGDAVREALANPEVCRALRAIIRVGLGRRPQGAGRQSETAVDDCFSETCSRALSAAGSYDESRGSVLNWLGGFAMTILRERRKRFPTCVDTSELESPDRSQPIPESISDRMQIEALSASLSPNEKQLLLWVYEGWTASEIGAELHLETTAVRVRIHRLKKKAKGLLGRASTRGADHE